ncbi:MAG: hypothetical protein ACXW2S_16925 [Telluria sp.]
MVGVINGTGSGFGGGTGSGGGIGTGCTGGGITMGGGGFGGGVVVQAANVKATAPSETSKLRRVDNIRTDMWILMIEGAIALFLFVFIVWWTMYSGPKPTDRHHDTKPAPADDEAPGQQD